MNRRRLFPVVLYILILRGTAIPQDEVTVSCFTVHEVTFKGPEFEPSDTPAADVLLYTEWRHASGGPSIRIYGFWDGDGRGGAVGNVFKVRFCPTRPGVWTLEETGSGEKILAGQKEGYRVICSASAYPGFWEADSIAASGRWYKRSDGSHPYIVGNTLYNFLTETRDNGPNGSDIISDVKNNARYFKKIRFSITGDRYPHPVDKPFLDHRGNPTDNGNFSHRPNPAWFYNRVDRAVQKAFENDLIADLILNGPDTENARSVLKAGESGGDPSPILQYIAARYGSYPNVWICLCNEWDIKTPRFTPEEVNAIGLYLKSLLPYPTPVSIHAAPTDWNTELNTVDPWNDHIILQYKIKTLFTSADFIEKNFWIGGGNKPVINDELAYEGRGDGWTEADVIEAHMGVFLGGGYGSTGFKDPGNKQGHYFWGAFRPGEHTSADNLKWLREVIDSNIPFWDIHPEVHFRYRGETRILSIFTNVHDGFRALTSENTYVLGTNQEWPAIEAILPEGKWEIVRYDVIRMEVMSLAENAEKRFMLDAPDSRAVLFVIKKVED